MLKNKPHLATFHGEWGSPTGEVANMLDCYNKQVRTPVISLCSLSD